MKLCTRLDMRCLACLASMVLAQATCGQAAREGAPANCAAAAQLNVQNRPFSRQGPPRSEIGFDPNTQTVSIKVQLQEPSGYFIPNIRRENFAVYENGKRQQNATVAVERSPVTLEILLEYGGRYRAMNEALGENVSAAASQFLDEIEPADQVTFWRYGENVQEIAGPSEGHDTVQRALKTLGSPPLSETNLYDALIATLAQMRTMDGRRALLLISSGLDTFSEHTFQETLQAVRTVGIPIYVINLDPVLERPGSPKPSAGPYAVFDWKRANAQLRQIAKASGGRMYSPELTFDLSAIYDDLMENLRARYVIAYRSSSDPAAETPRTVRVELVDSRTGGPLQIVDAAGRVVGSCMPRIAVESSYLPHATPIAGMQLSNSSQGNATASQ